MNRYAKASILAIAIATVGGLATQAGARTSENDALAVTRAGISLTRAVTLAEQHAQGKAARAEFEPGRQGAVYEVEVVSANGVFDVKVDADKGTVLSSSADRRDRDDEDRDERDHDERRD